MASEHQGLCRREKHRTMAQEFRKSLWTWVRAPWLWRYDHIQLVERVSKARRGESDEATAYHFTIVTHGK
jgi:hypothetical protein